MTKHKLYIKVRPQILKDLLNTLLNCKATFECNSAVPWLLILDVTRFHLEDSRSDQMYKLQIDTENNSKDIFIAAANVDAFTVHFQC